MRKVIEDSRRPDIFFRNNGRIDITSSVSRRLGLKEGDIIGIAEYGGEYYIYKRIDADRVLGKHRGEVHLTNGNSRYFRVWCKDLTDYMNNVCRSEESHLMCGDEMDFPSIGKAIPIITRINLYKNDKEH